MPVTSGSTQLNSEPRVSEPASLHVGARLRHARLLCGLRLKDVAKRARRSESLLSKLENERAAPSLTTLHRVCKVLGISVSTLLKRQLGRSWTIMRPEERPVIGRAQASVGKGMRAEVLVPHTEWRLLEGFIVTIDPGGHSDGVFQHRGEAVGYIIDGTLELTIGGEGHLLHPGYSFHFPSDLPHAYSNPGKKPVKAIWINTPPTF
jgi:transcriptional regulator with XRE-family HTH domain